MLSGDCRRSDDVSDSDDYPRPQSRIRAHVSSSRRSTRSLNGPRDAAQLRLLPTQNETLPSSSGSLTFLETPSPEPSPEKITWRSLPHKDQLAILVLARLSEPLVGTSLQSYMFYMLQSFDPSLPPSTISAQAGMLAGAFTFAQFLTALLWGRLSDSPRLGRKSVLLLGLTGSLLSVLGFGFSKSYAQAVVCRTLGGALNGNVGVMRTMTSEIVQEKKYQSRAFLLLPFCFNIGVIVGPIMGGVLADPAGTYPGLFGDVEWMKTYRYSLPNIASACILGVSLLCVLFGLDETLPLLRGRPDVGRKIGRKLTATFPSRGNKQYVYTSIDIRVSSSMDLTEHLQDHNNDEDEESSKPRQQKFIYTQTLPFLRIFTPNVLFTLLSHFLLGIHLGAFNNLWYIFLSAPVSRTPAQGLAFTGGLGMPPSHVGMAMAILGVLGITLQFLFYANIQDYFGLLKSFRLFLIFFVPAYTLVPFLALVPSTTPAPHEKTGILVWLSICAVLFIQVVGRTMVLPAIGILVNNCSPHPSVLGSVHGVGQSVASLARTFGPVLGGWIFGRGLDIGVVGLAWWLIAGVAILGFASGWWVKEGTGWEIVLDGDEPPHQEVIVGTDV